MSLPSISPESSNTMPCGYNCFPDSYCVPCYYSHLDKIIEQYGLQHLFYPEAKINQPKDEDDDDQEINDDLDMEDLDQTINLTNTLSYSEQYMPLIEEPAATFHDIIGLDPNGYNKYTLINVDEYVPNIDDDFGSWLYFTKKIWQRQKTFKQSTN